jgi:hypothetical protein
MARPKLVWHGGVFGAALSGVGSVGARTLTIAGAAWTTNQWAGCDCVVVAKADLSEVTLMDYRVASNTATVLTIASTSPDPAVASVAPGDVLLMLSKPTVAGLTVTDANWQNSLENGGLGLTPHQERGRVLRIVWGTGRGYRYAVADNTATSITIVGPWIVAPDSTSRYVIEDAADLPDRAQWTATPNADPAAGVELDLPVANYAGETLLVEVVALDAKGVESAPQNNPVRMVYVPGAGGTRTVAANATQSLIDGVMLHNTAAGSQSLQLLASTAVRNRTLLVRKASGDTNAVTIHCATGDTFPDGSTTITLATADDAVLLKFPGSGNVVIPIGGSGSGLSGGSSGSTYTTHPAPLTAAYTLNSPGTPADGDTWAVRLDQDATGGRAVTAGANVMLLPQIDSTVNADGGTFCLLTFTGWGGKWYCGGNPILGRKIV